MTVHFRRRSTSTLPDRSRRSFVTAIAWLGSSLCVGPGWAQAQPAGSGYPNRPIRLVVAFAPGSATDTVARLFAEKLGDLLGQSIFVDNRPGGVGIIGASAVANAPPDGYTLLVGTNTTNAAVRALVKSVPFDPEKDFTPISFLGVLPQVVVVNNNVPAKTLPELLALARAKPDGLTYSWTSSVTRVATEMLASMANVRFLNVPYKAGGTAMTDVISGEVNFTTVDTIVALPQIKSGKVRALAVTSSARVPQLPDVPTVAEAANLPGYELLGIFAAFGPAHLPPEIVNKLNGAIQEVGRSADLRNRFAAMGLDVQTTTPEQLRTRFQNETKKWTKVASDAGIEPM